MTAFELFDLKTAIKEVCRGSLSVETLKAAIEKGTLRAKRSSPADPSTKKPASGKYLVSRADVEAWFKTLDDA